MEIITIIAIWLWFIFGTIMCISCCGCSLTFVYDINAEISEENPLCFISVGEIIFNILGTIFIWFLIFLMPILVHYLR